jgi:hypothetical protein
MCAPGQFASSVGLTSCVDSPAGYFASTYGLSSPSACPSRTYSAAAATSCLACPTGASCAALGVSCQPGTFQLTAASVCAQCAVEFSTCKTCYGIVAADGNACQWTGALAETDGFSVTVYLNRTVNTTVVKMGAFPCSAIFSGAVLFNLGVGPVCTGLSSQRVQVEFGMAFHADAFQSGSLLILNPGMFTDAVEPVTCKVYASTHTTTVAVFLSVPGGTVGVCDSMMLDSSGSAGSLGRPFRYTWRLSAAVPTVSPDAWNNITAILALASGNAQPQVTVPSSMLTPGVSYTIGLTLTNWLGSSSSETVVGTTSAQWTLPIYLTDVFIPTISRVKEYSIAASTITDLRALCFDMSNAVNFSVSLRWSQIVDASLVPSSLNTSAVVPYMQPLNLPSLTRPTPVRVRGASRAVTVGMKSRIQQPILQRNKTNKYERWRRERERERSEREGESHQQVSSSALHDPETLPQCHLTPALLSQVLTIPPFTLPVRSVALFRATLRARFSDALSGAVTSIQSHSDVVALFVAPSALVARILGGHRTVWISRLAPAFVLSSGSFDPDVTGDNQDGLSYTWRCVRIVSRAPCFQTVLLTQTTAQLEFSAAALEPSAVDPFEFQLTVTKDTRISTSVPVFITGLKLALPQAQITIAVPTAFVVPWQKINAHDRVQLNANVQQVCTCARRVNIHVCTYYPCHHPHHPQLHSLLLLSLCAHQNCP